MVTARLVGVFFLVIAAIAVGAEVVDFFRTARWTPISAAQLWLNLDASSLISTRAFFDRNVFPGLWDSVIVWILRQPAWLVCIIPGGICLLSSITWRAEAPRKRGEKAHKRERARLQGSH